MSIGYLIVGMICAAACASLSVAFGGSAQLAVAVYVITGQLVLLALVSMAVVHTATDRSHAAR